MHAAPRGVRLAAIATAAAALVGLAGGCFAPTSITCSDGRICPIGSRCDVKNHLCLSPNQASSVACEGRAEADDCVLSGAPGKCHAGICEPLHCGDGIRGPGEACEGTDLGGQTCHGLHFYGQTVGLRCTASCTFDTSGCDGYCGDGLVNGPEQCDGAPAQTCIALGFDHGFAGCSDTCQHAADGCATFGGWGPSYAQTLAGGRRGIWASGSDDVYVVGNSTVLHWNGGGWSATDRAITGAGTVSLFGVWGSGPKDVWAVGSGAGGPSVFRWNGSTWTTHTLATSMALGIWGSGPNDVYVVGTGIWHWDGTAWTKVDDGAFQSVYGTGPRDVYALGGKYTPVAHFDGTAWTPMAVPPGEFIYAWASGPTNLYASGRNGLIRWNGSAWSQVTSDLLVGVGPVWGTGPDDVAVVAGNGVVRWNGNVWFKETVTVPGGGADLFTAIWVGGGTGFLVGYTDILRLDRTAWATRPWTGAPTALNAVWGAPPDHLFAVGDNGTLAHWDGAAWSTTALDATQPMRGVWGNAPDDVLAVGDNRSDDPVVNLAHWDGNRWSRPAGAPSMPPSGTLRGVWSSGPTDVYLAGESQGLSCVLHWNGTGWSLLDDVFPSQTIMGPPDPHPGFGEPLRGVWGRGGGDVYVFGGSSALSHWDGRRWSRTSPGAIIGSLTGVWASGPTDVYTIDDYGSVNHLAPYHHELPTSMRLWAVGGSGPGDVFVAGDDVLLHQRGDRWDEIALPVAGSVRGLYVTPSRVTVVGTMGEVHLDRPTVTCVGPELDCNDGWDNDCDGLQDVADPDCAGKVPERCGNERDDDADGLPDCADPDCAAFPACKGF